MYHLRWARKHARTYMHIHTQVYHHQTMITTTTPYIKGRLLAGRWQDYMCSKEKSVESTKYSRFHYASFHSLDKCLFIELVIASPGQQLSQMGASNAPAAEMLTFPGV